VHLISLPIRDELIKIFYLIFVRLHHQEAMLSIFKKSCKAQLVKLFTEAPLSFEASLLHTALNPGWNNDAHEIVRRLGSPDRFCTTTKLRRCSAVMAQSCFL
jgi:hypothetical protein